MIKPSVSIIIITYNQEKFISQAIDSVLEQKDIGDIEIIIGDDASKDGTKAILDGYKSKYPNVFNIFSRPINLGPTKNFYELFKHCNGDYIAVLEGDDYWTDPYKLFKQTNFLEKDNSFIACVHRYKTIDENDNVIQDEYSGHGTPKLGLYTLDDFKNYIYFGHLGTLLFRNFIKNGDVDYSIIKYGHEFIADITLNLLLCFFGKIEVLDLNMASMRTIVIKDGTNFKSAIQKKNQVVGRINYLKKLQIYALEEFNYDLNYRDRNAYHFAWSILFLLKYPSLHNWKAFLYTYKLNKNKIKLFWYLIKNLDRLFAKLRFQFNKIFSR